MYQFHNENREISFDSYNTPTPWMNYLSNGTLHAMISQAGGGVAWYRSPQIWRINHYRFFHLPTDRSFGLVYCLRLSSKETMMRSTDRSTIRVVGPGTALDSCTAVGTTCRAPIFSAGKLA